MARAQVLRPPGLPSREGVPEDERAAYDSVVNLVEQLSSQRVAEDPFASASLNAPPFAAALWGLKRLILATAEGDNSFSHRERALIDVVVAFDSEHYGVLDGLLQWVVRRASLDVDIIEALWNERENDLSEEDRRVVEYVRAVANRRVTDDSFLEMSARFGPRGAVEFTVAIAYTRLINQLMRALGTPSKSREEMQTTIDGLRAGTVGAPDYGAYEGSLREFAENPKVPTWVLDRTLRLY